MCRANLTARVQKCLLNCDACGAECTSSVVRSLVSAYRCSLGMPTIGLAASFHSSDVGFTIGTRWGAIRERRRPPAPEDAFQEQYRMLIQNRVDKPMAPRNCEPSTQPTTPCLHYTIQWPLTCLFPAGSRFVPQAPPRVNHGPLCGAAQREGRDGRA